MKESNLSIELLNKLLGDEIRVTSKGDIIKGEEFSERLKKIMRNYRKSMVDNAESLDKFIGIASETGDNGEYKLGSVRDELLKLAKDLINLHEENKALGLSREEIAFYHAISKPENIKDFYTDKELIEFTQELTRTIAQEMTSDWMMRESGRANMRRKVKRLLAKYKYPKDQRNNVIDLIVEQAEYYDGLMEA